MSESVTGRADARAAVVGAAARLLQKSGPAAVTTRGVAEEAGVQAPTIYRLFGDKDGLLDAVAEHVMAAFVERKATDVADAAAADVDPLDDLRASWSRQIEFGLANPAVFRLLSDPARAQGSPAAARGRQILETRIRRLAADGRLRVSESRAVDMVQAAGIGAIQTLLAAPSDRRDPALGNAMMDAVLARILTDASADAPDGPVPAAVALRAHAATLDVVSNAERRLLVEWLDRIVGAQERP